MKRTIQSLLILCGWLAFCPASAQVVEKADVSVAFDLSQPGVRYSPTWGVDVAWPNEQNVRKALYLSQETSTFQGLSRGHRGVCDNA